MAEDVIPTFGELSDDELIERYRKAKGPNRLQEDEAEMRRRGLMPDREDTIPEEPPGDIPAAAGPVEAIEPGPVSETDNGGPRR